MCVRIYSIVPVPDSSFGEEECYGLEDPLGEVSGMGKRQTQDPSLSARPCTIHTRQKNKGSLEMVVNCSNRDSEWLSFFFHIAYRHH